MSGAFWQTAQYAKSVQKLSSGAAAATRTNIPVKNGSVLNASDVVSLISTALTQLPTSAQSGQPFLNGGVVAVKKGS